MKILQKTEATNKLWSAAETLIRFREFEIGSRRWYVL